MEKVRKIIGPELAQFEIYFKQAVKSKVALLDRIMYYIVKRKGKQLRPMFVLLCARLGGDVTQQSYRAASLVELLHTATLVHDDIVDDANERRGFFSINALWKNKIAVLVGDYLLSKGLLLSLENNDFHILQYLSTAVKQMSEGELLQMEKSRNLNLSEETYFEIIKGKTASLLASACAAGASTTFVDSTYVDKLRLFGEYTGMAFQLKDDLFDYGNPGIGKPTGNDIKEQKLSLPLIYTLNNCDRNTRKKLLYTIKNENRKKERIQWVVQTVAAHGGIDYATKKMLAFRDQALDILEEFPENEVRHALEELVRFTTDRTF